MVWSVQWLEPASLQRCGSRAALQALRGHEGSMIGHEGSRSILPRRACHLFRMTERKEQKKADMSRPLAGLTRRNRTCRRESSSRHTLAKHHMQNIYPVWTTELAFMSLTTIKKIHDNIFPLSLTIMYVSPNIYYALLYSKICGWGQIFFFFSKWGPPNLSHGSLNFKIANHP